MKCMIKTDHATKDHLFLHSKTFNNIELERPNNVKLKVGSIERNVQLTKHDQDDGTIYLSSNLLEGYSFPDSIPFELRIKENTVHLGPILGLLVRGETDKLTSRRINIYKNYLVNYQQINGMIVLFAQDGIDHKNNKILGYVYNPEEHVWVRGILPLPSAVFIRRNIKASEREAIQKIVGNKYFNSAVFNKWEMWQLFCKDLQLKKYFPETIQAKELSKMKDLLSKYKEVYMKPISGMQGSKVYRIVSNLTEYRLYYRVNGNNITSVFDDWTSLVQFLQSEFNLKKFLAQKAISLLRIQKDNRVMDFRIIVVKDQNGCWYVPGGVTRYGDIDSIVSNISSGGSAERVWDSLLVIFQKDAKKAFQKYKQLESLAIQCCQKLERAGYHLGYIGIDIGMDKNHDLWVIEINNRSPDMTIALDANDPPLYYKIKAAPMHYAKWLAGYGDDQT